MLLVFGEYRTDQHTSQLFLFLSRAVPGVACPPAIIDLHFSSESGRRFRGRSGDCSCIDKIHSCQATSRASQSEPPFHNDSNSFSPDPVHNASK